MARNPKGAVAIEKRDGRLGLRWRVNGKRETLAIGRADDKAVVALAQKLARQIELDILSGNYDPTKERYQTIERRKRSVVELWDEFTAARGMGEDSKYKALRGHLSKWGERVAPHGVRLIERVGTVQARGFLDKVGGANSTKRSYLSLLSACWEWGQVEENPWQSINLPKSESPDPDPFSQAEVDLILKGFADSYYLNFVKALLGTGCRPGELAAVTWSDVRWLRNEICINKSWNPRTRKLKTTKTGKARMIPLGKTMRGFLEVIMPVGAEEDDLIFPGPRGAYLDVHNFLKRQWEPALKQVGVRYRPTYTTRHTVWSHGIAEGMPIAEAAKYAGNRPETMVRHYLGSVSKSEMPDLLGGKD